MKKYHLLPLSIVLCLATSAQAGLSPLALSLFPPVEVPPQGFDVAGVRLDILWGEHRDVYGFDVGAGGNITDGDFGGIQVAGGFNYNKQNVTALGLQVAGGVNVNVNKTNVIGLQVAGLMNNNQAESSVVGLQVSLINKSTFTTIYGAQVGLYNSANTVNGFQIGLINVTDSLHGLQIGLANINSTGLFSFAPILNVGF